MILGDDRAAERWPVFADERQARIAELVSTRGRARIGELAEAFGVTEPTIRKDLSALQARGVLKRTYGGALALHPIIDREFADREAANRAGKEAIARACVELVHDGDSVFLDSGTTVDAVARALAARNRRAGLRLSVLTNTLAVAPRSPTCPASTASCSAASCSPSRGRSSARSRSRTSSASRSASPSSA